MTRTREQARAQQVYQQIIAINQDLAIRENYGIICLNFPAYVHQCGLCQAVAFLQSKANSDPTAHPRKRAYHRFLQDLSHSAMQTTIEQFTQSVRKAPLIEYQRLTREVMALANWYKRYAEAVLKVEPGQEDADNARTG